MALEMETRKSDRKRLPAPGVDSLAATGGGGNRGGPRRASTTALLFRYFKTYIWRPGGRCLG